MPDPTLPKGSLGRPLDGIDVVILDPVTAEEKPRARYDEHGKLLNAGEAIGELVSRNATSRFEGYYNNPEADAERTRNGWYWSGDLGYRDEAGVFWFAGRNADWIRVDGENFAAAPDRTHPRPVSRRRRRRRVRRARQPDRRPGDGRDRDAGRRHVRSRRVRDLPRRAARPRHQVGAALRAHRRRRCRSARRTRSTSARCAPSGGTRPIRCSGARRAPRRTCRSPRPTPTRCAPSSNANGRANLLT